MGTRSPTNSPPNLSNNSSRHTSREHEAKFRQKIIKNLTWCILSFTLNLIELQDHIKMATQYHTSPSSPILVINIKLTPILR